MAYYVVMQVETGTYHTSIADFGLSKVIPTMGAGRSTIQAGTPAFQPPEQLKGELCGEGSDIYAFGCIITEIFGERAVWPDMSPHTIIFKVAGGSFPSVDHLPVRIRELVRELCFVPVDTRASATKILEALCNLPVE